MSPLAVKCRLCVRHQCVYDVVRFRFTCIIIWYTQRPKNVNGASRSKRYGSKEKKRKKEHIRSWHQFFRERRRRKHQQRSRRRKNQRRSRWRKEETVPHDRKIYTLHIFAHSIRSINFASHVQQNYTTKKTHKHTHTDTQRNGKTIERSLYRLSTSGMFSFVVQALVSLSCSAFRIWSVYVYWVASGCVFVSSRKNIHSFCAENRWEKKTA